MNASEAKSEKDFAPTPEGWYQRWKMELDAAKKELEKWHKQGHKIVKRFRDERESHHEGDYRWNFFTANIQTQEAMLFGKAPSVDVVRRFGDSNDDIARVAGETLERLLNSDIQRDGDGYTAALKYALSDRLLPGLGNARVRYENDFGDEEGEDSETGEGIEKPAIVKDGIELAPAVPKVPKKKYECVEIDYIHWEDQLWSPCRVFHEMRWWSHKSPMTRDGLIKRFPKYGATIPLNYKKSTDYSSEEKKNDPWGRAEVWEIWDKEHKKIFWFVDGFGKILDEQDDTYRLDGFWPFPRPMFANFTTSTLVPRPDYVLAQDIYEEIDIVSTRIKKLEECIKVAGVYDETSEGVQRLVNGSSENELIPIKNWARFQEKGGVDGQIGWLPLNQIVVAMDKLREYRTELVGTLYQLTGMSDIMRGQSSEVGVTATEQSIKAKFASVRVQALQDDFARFASELQGLKAELIAKFFDEQTILEQSNALYTFDAQMAMQAVKLIKSDYSKYRIEVKPEAISMTDFAALKQERSELLLGMTSFIQQAAPIAQAMPGSMPFLLQMLQWAIAGFKGASTIEGVLDQAIAQAQQMAQQPQPQQSPDPKLIATQMKAQADMQKTQADLQAQLMLKQADVKAENEKQRIQTEWNIKEQAEKDKLKMQMQAHSAMAGVSPIGGAS